MTAAIKHPKEGYYCQQCGAGFGECMACELPDCGPYVRNDNLPTPKPATPPPEGERNAIAKMLLDEISRGCDINEREALRCADRLLAAGYVRPAPTQRDLETAEAIALKHHANSKSMLADDVATALAAQRATLEARAAELERQCAQWKAAADAEFRTHERADAAEAALATAMKVIADEIERLEDTRNHGGLTERGVIALDKVKSIQDAIAAAIAAERTGGTK